MRNMFFRLAALAAVLLLAACSRDPMPEAIAIAETADEKTDDYYLFIAKQPTTDVCYIFYTGGLVKEEAYAPYAKALAENGVHTFLLEITMDMSALDKSAPDDAKNSEFAKQNCRAFAVGGHSLGGLTASEYVFEHPDDGLVMISAYPYGTSLKEHRAPIMTIYGSEDPLSSEEEILEARDEFVPESGMYRRVEGGNHGQFGWYGEQSGDGKATITLEQQQALLLEHTLELIRAMP